MISRTDIPMYGHTYMAHTYMHTYIERDQALGRGKGFLLFVTYLPTYLYECNRRDDDDGSSDGQRIIILPHQSTDQGRPQQQQDQRLFKLIHVFLT